MIQYLAAIRGSEALNHFIEQMAFGTDFARLPLSLMSNIEYLRREALPFQ